MLPAAAPASPPFTVGIVLYPGVDILDVAGPHEVFGFFDGSVIDRTIQVATVAATTQPIPTSGPLKVVAQYDFYSSPHIDLLFVPGGGNGLQDAIGDTALLDFLKQRAPEARYVVSVCTGGLILASAGLLDGYQATTHWAFIDCLKLFPTVTVVNGCPRWYKDRNRITGGGISSSVDESLFMVQTIVTDLAGGPDAADKAALAAQKVQLSIQYHPDPPFPGGDPCSVAYDVFEPVNAGMTGFRGALDAAIEARLHPAKVTVEA
ncbi:DJ-1/PfpI family protein [Caulobacter hibisci]|uniref:DJ-1/PfpI family protein n=1 Tax=Caulobacter hibisci TaxID=2035993 RepID=A0ABS0SZ25_9CAUL|nr:DJ-1/PfpI family protein [Caulobacter hibisci]